MLRMRIVMLAGLIAMAGPAPAQADRPDESARAILEQAVAAAGGETWLNPSTLYLAGRAVFYAPDSAEPRSIADDYRMWRAMNPDRTTAHGADGKVRITARSSGRLLFEVGYDGTTTWTEKGGDAQGPGRCLKGEQFRLRHHSRGAETRIPAGARARSRHRRAQGRAEPRASTEH